MQAKIVSQISFLINKLLKYRALKTPSQLKRLRRTLRERRRALSSSEIHRASTIIIQKLIATDIFQHSNRIALYMPSDGEIDPTLIWQAKESATKQFYLPVVTKNQPLLFVHYQPPEPLQTNQWQIKEPKVAADKICSPEQLDLVIVPVVAFDKDNNRLGRGGGYYDQTFAVKLKNPQAKPYLIGVAYSWQKVRKLPRYAWDIPLDIVISEQ